MISAQGPLTWSLGTNMRADGSVLDARRHALWRIASGYIGLLWVPVRVYLALSAGDEPSVRAALFGRAANAFFFSSVLAVFAVASAIEFRAQLGWLARCAGYVPAVVFLSVGVWLWVGA